MRRGPIIAIYALGGLGVALSLSFATFAVAGQDLNDPAYPVRPVAVPTAGRSTPTSSDDGATAHGGPTHTPHPGTLSTAPAGESSGGDGSSHATSTESPEKPGQGSGSSSSSPSPGDDGSHGGDGGGGGGDD